MRDIAEVEVQLLIYSGRRDPGWTLTADQATALLDLAEDVVSQAIQAQSAIGGLGYRGFKVTVKSGARVPHEFRVFREVLSAPGIAVRDASGLERWLLADAASRGFGDILAASGAPLPPIAS